MEKEDYKEIPPIYPEFEEDNRAPAGPVVIIFGWFLTLLALFTPIVTGMESMRLGLNSLLSIGCSLILTGLILNFLHGGKYTITPDSVDYSRKTFLGTRRWSEPLSQYRGVITRRENRNYEESFPDWSDIFYLVELLHTSPKKTIKLYESNSKMEAVEVSERYSIEFGVEMLETTPDGYRERRSATWKRL